MIVVRLLAFIVCVLLIAWLFGESARRPEMPANTLALLLLAAALAGLVLQPDFGQTMLIALVWGALFFLAGMRFIWVAGLGGAAAVGLAAAYLLVPYVARRTVDLAPALVLSAQLLFGALFGIMGLALADPLVAMLKTALEQKSKEDEAEAAA